MPAILAVASGERPPADLDRFTEGDIATVHAAFAHAPPDPVSPHLEV